MPTNKPKVTAYLDYENYDSFERFRRENSLTASQAFNKLVELFFKDDTSKSTKKVGKSEDLSVSREEVRDSEQGIALEEYVTDLVNERVTSWRDTIFTDQWLAGFCQTYQFSVTPSTSPLEDAASKDWVEELVKGHYSQAMDQVNCAIANLRDELLGLMNTSADAQTDSPNSVYTLGETRDAKNIPQSLTGSGLAKRLGISPSQITRHRDRTDFPQWTAGKDPDGIRWKYAKAQAIYRPADFEKEPLN